MGQKQKQKPCTDGTSKIPSFLQLPATGAVCSRNAPTKRDAPEGVRTRPLTHSQTGPRSWPNAQSRPESGRPGTRFLPRPAPRPRARADTVARTGHGELVRSPDNSTRKVGNEAIREASPRDGTAIGEGAGCRNPRRGGGEGRGREGREASRSSEGGGGMERNRLVEAVVSGGGWGGGGDRSTGGRVRRYGWVSYL